VEQNPSLWVPGFNAPGAVSGMRPPWISRLVATKPTSRTAKSAASRMCFMWNGTGKRKKLLLRRSWNSRGEETRYIG
jgi:hypothetical protein